MTNINRKNIYNITFSFIKNNQLTEFPLSIERLCKILNAELVPLTNLVKNTGLTLEQLFSIMGNDDAVVTYYANTNTIKILYNDLKSRERVHFSIMEELGHIILCHIYDDEFNIYKQSYSDKKYKNYDKEARICAGFLLIPPNLYYNEFRGLPVTLISEVFQISISCAKVRCDVYEKFRNEICENIYFNSLPKMTVNLKGTILEPLEVS